MAYRYRITIETLSVRAGNEQDGASPQFCTDNDDGLLKIAEMIRSKRWLDKDKSASLVIGFRLFSEIILETRHDQLFAPLVLPIRDSIQRLKHAQAHMMNR
jgi:hypothetical protein